MNVEQIFDKIQHPKLFAPQIISRRGFLGFGVAAASMAATSASANVSALLCPPQVGKFGGGRGSLSTSGENYLANDTDFSSAMPDDGPGVRHLIMKNPHTGETFAGNYVENGEYNQAVLKEFSRFARDWRENDVRDFSPKTLDIIYKVWKELGMTEPFRLNSGYRSPVTNAALESKGAASQSLHMKALAADISCDSRTPLQVHKVAKDLKAGGVGRYNGFTHVDSGTVRYWG